MPADTSEPSHYRKVPKASAALDEDSRRPVEPIMSYAEEFEWFMETFVRSVVHRFCGLASSPGLMNHERRVLSDVRPDMTGLTAFACQECGRALVRHVKRGERGYDFFGCSGYLDGCMTLYDNHGGEPVRRV